ncbi:MAG TPA: hypothetical protein VGR18_08035 [Rubrobacter sp.]|nr:hypothetical protein [Rubrobacter sp.]
MEAPITQATARNNTIVAVFPNHVEIRTGWQSQNVESFNLREISVVATKGLVNATLKIETNKGRVLELTRMAPPDARRVRSTIESQKRLAGLYE